MDTVIQIEVMENAVSSGNTKNIAILVRDEVNHAILPTITAISEL